MDYSKKIKQGDVSTTLDTRTRNEGKLAFLPLPFISTERSEWRNLIILKISEYNRVCIDIIVKQQIRHLEGGTTERSTVYDDM